MDSELKILMKISEIIGKEFTETNYLDIKEWGHRKANHYEIERGAIVKLKINSCQFKVIPSLIFELKNLVELSLTHNEIDDIPKEIGKLKGLKSLILANNKIQNLPTSFTNLNQLTHLDLSFNNLSAIPDSIFKLNNLRHLNLSSNNITLIPSKIKNLKLLTYLLLSSNKISEIPPQISNLTKLHSLFLAKNSIRIVPKILLELKDLDTFVLNENPVKQPPPEIIQLEIKDIFEYLRQLPDDESGVEFNEAKLIIVGQGDVGKTCLTNRLLTNSFNEKEFTTEGISINQWDINAPDPSDKTIKLNIWDFGGQEIYHATHQLFLTTRSVYLLVWNARRARDYDNIYYWLHTIEAFSNNSPIILVLTKYHERDDDLNMKDLKELFPQIIGLFKVDNADGYGINELKQKIADTAWNLPQMGDKWIDRWLKVRYILEQDKRNWISYSDYLCICSENGLTKDESKTLSEYLHQLGVILNFSDNLLLRHLVVLKPEWATNAIYKVLDYKPVRDAEGVLDHYLLDKIWQDIDYPPDIYPILLELMNKFELAYALTDKPAHLIPQLLPSTEPDFEWNPINDLKYFYTYNFLPAGILTRLIVRIHADIETFDNKQICWREGVIINKGKGRALIKIKPYEKQIQLFIQGEQIRDLLIVIKDHIDHIHKSINKIAVREEIPCNCSENCQKKWDYNNLINLEKNSIDLLTCDYGAKPFSIKTLLDGYENLNQRNLRYYNALPNHNIIFHNNISIINQQFNLKKELSSFSLLLEELKKEIKDEVREEYYPLLEDLQSDISKAGSGISDETIFNKIVGKTKQLFAKVNGPQISKLVNIAEKGIDLVSKIDKFIKVLSAWIDKIPS